MPPPVPYTPRRRLIMNLVLWGLLAVTVAGAALLARAKRDRWHTDLEGPATYGALEVRLPKGWEVSSGMRRGGTQVIARDPDGQRALYISTSRRGASPDLSMLDAMRLRGRDLSRYDVPISVPGGKGTFIHVVDEEENPVLLLAVLAFDAGPTVVVNLQDEGEGTPADEALVSDVAKSIRLHAGPPVERDDNAESFDL